MKFLTILLLISVSLPAQAVLTVKVDENGEAKIGNTTFKLNQRASYDEIRGSTGARLITDEVYLGVHGTLKVGFQRTEASQDTPMEEKIYLGGGMSLCDISQRISGSSIVESFVSSETTCGIQYHFLTFLSKIPGQPLKVDISALRSPNYLAIENIFPQSSSKTREDLCLSYSRSDYPGEVFYATRDQFGVDESHILDFSD